MATQTPYRATAESAQPPGHGGLRSYGAMAFFAQPPTEIGPVLSAESTLSDGVVAVTPVARAVTQGCQLHGCYFPRSGVTLRRVP